MRRSLIFHTGIRNCKLLLQVVPGTHVGCASSSTTIFFLLLLLREGDKWERDGIKAEESQRREEDKRGKCKNTEV